MERKNKNRCLVGPGTQDQGVQSLIDSGGEFILPSTAVKSR